MFNTDKVQGIIRGNVNMESLQDTYTYDSNQKNMGFNLDVDLKGAGSSLSVNGGKTDIAANSKMVGQQTGLFANEADLVVEGTGNFTGAVFITSEEAQANGKSNIVFKQGVTSTDIVNTTSYEGDAISVGVSIGKTFNPSMNGLGYGTDGDSDSSITKGGVSGYNDPQGNLTTDNREALGGKLESVFDATRVNEELGAQTQITKEFGKEAPKAVGDFASNRQIDLLNQGKVEEADKWAEGGAYRVALHTLIGAIATGSVDGALASGTTAVSIPAVSNYLDKQGVDETTKSALLLGLSAGVGAVVGGDTASTATSFSQTQNNHLSHKQIAEWGKELESCVKNKGSQCTIAAKEAINDKYIRKSEQQQQELRSACGSNGSAQQCNVLRNNYYNVEGIPYDEQVDKYAPKIISYGYGSKASSKLAVVQTMHNMEAEGIFANQTANQEREKGKSGKAFAMEMAPVIAAGVIAGKAGSNRGNVTKVVPNGKHIQVETKTRIISGAKVEDKPTGRVITGNVDLKPTIDRINSGQKSKHRNDGENFRNSQGRLPAKPKEYYTEYVVPPPPTFRYPGAQRVVVGKNGETYYTPNHYESFIRVQ